MSSRLMKQKIALKHKKVRTKINGNFNNISIISVAISSSDRN
jgi:hypothetical protein